MQPHRNDVHIIPRPAVCLIILLVLLIGCTNKPTRIQHYTLPAATTDVQESDSDPIFIETTIKTADYLSASGINYQTSEYRIESAYGHRWAGSLAEQLRRQLHDELLQQYPGYRFTAGGETDDETLFLIIEIDKFHGRHDGIAVISGRWTLRDAQRNYLTGRNFAEQTPLSTDGYEALVESLAQGWRNTIRKIDSQIQTIKTESG